MTLNTQLRLSDSRRISPGQGLNNAVPPDLLKLSVHLREGNRRILTKLMFAKASLGGG